MPLLINPSQNLVSLDCVVPHILAFHMLSSLFTLFFCLGIGKPFLVSLPISPCEKLFGLCHLYARDSQGCRSSPLSSRLCAFLDIIMHILPKKMSRFLSSFLTRSLHLIQVFLTQEMAFHCEAQLLRPNIFKAILSTQFL